MPPQAFARVDVPTRMFYTEVQKTNEVAGDAYSELIGRTRTRFRKPAFYIPFSITGPVPLNPPSHFASSEFLMLKFVTVEQFNTVKELFNRRPIMTKMFISYETRISNEKLKYIMPLLSYYYTTGPWRVMWVRFGYDPRKDFESRYYQQLDYRARLFVSKWKEVSSNSQPVSKQRPTRKTAEMKKAIDCPYFDSDRLPKSMQCIYQVKCLLLLKRLSLLCDNKIRLCFQYCDIRVPQIQEMLDKIPTPLSGATCNEKSGWLPTGFDDQCREILTGIVKGLLETKRKNDALTDEYEVRNIFNLKSPNRMK